MHKRLGPNQQTLRTLWTNGPLLLSRQERSERTSPFLAEHVRRSQSDPANAGKYAPHIHRAFGNLQTWLNGIHHGVDPKYLQRYLDEFVFRYNRRETPMVTFRSLLKIVTGSSKPLGFKALKQP